ncbi:hypothetical protein E3H11_42480 [Bradyrhizobium brasilense]|uniref:hypothetical protein n=1 Tax=Bradyrhizobium brasilense TaxID=1419277 RepID=UPI0014565EC4|nr:hypothetical protein [Bradyrhizobium brasilense]NLS75362.1 hypothetical protein [Bradyrhizobium brasilense]
MSVVFKAGRNSSMPRDYRFASEGMLSVLLNRTLLAVSAGTTTTLFSWMLCYSSYAFDLNDEGLHLNSIANPFAYAINFPPPLFGFIYPWAYPWGGGDIAVRRLAKVTRTIALGWTLSFVLVRRIWTAGWPNTAMLSVGTVSLTLELRSWLLAPRYYALILQSFLMVVIGLLLADWLGCIRQVLGWLLVGIGSWRCFMANPATAAAIALVIMLYAVVLRRKLLLPMLGVTLVALALLIAIAHLIDGGGAGLMTRMVNSAELETLLGAGHEVSRMFRIDRLVTSRSQLAIVMLVAIALLLSILLGSTHKFLRSLALTAVLILTIIIALVGIDPTGTKPSTLFLVPAFTRLGAMFYREGLVLLTQAPASAALALTFLVMPHLSALGSSGNYRLIGSKDAVFWMPAVLAFLSPLAQQGRSVATLLPLTVLAPALVVNGGILKPYRQVKGLRAYTAVMPLPGGENDYLTTVRAQARTAGLRVMPALDLSGRLPGLLYVFETQTLSLPWLIETYSGGYAVPENWFGQPRLFVGYLGTNAAAVEALGLENCADLAKESVRVEPEGRLHLDKTTVMASVGAGRADYVAAATFETPVNDGEFPNAYRQFLFKPVGPAVLAEQFCREVWS